MLPIPRLLIAAAAAAATLCPLASPAAPDPKPNFVVILVDDMGYGDIGPFGSKVNRTPNLDRMAAEGMKLSSFYCAPVCTASRAQLLTGCYSKRVSLVGALRPISKTGLNPSEKTVASLLKDHGYTTMCIGKWHLGDQPPFLPTSHGFDHYFGLPYSNDMYGKNPVPSDGVYKGEGPDMPPLPLMRDRKVVEAPADQEKLVDEYTQEAIKFIETNKERPFFLYLPHNAVHVPLYPGKAFAGKSANGKHGDWVEEVDWSVGQILETLRRLKLDQNTMVLFTSDNGPWLQFRENAGVPTPLKGGKFSSWEGGSREPALAWWPGKIPAGAECSSILSQIDILPTLVSLAGGNVPEDRKIDGKNIWPLLAGKTTESPHEALYYWQGKDLGAVRSGDWKLLLQPQKPLPPAKKSDAKPDKKTADKSAAHDPNFRPQLYNLREDISESTDVSAQNPEVVARLMELVGKMDADLGVKKDTAPGIRPAGFFENPKPILKKTGHEYD